MRRIPAPARRADLAGGEAAARECADPYRDVGITRGDVDQRVGQRHVELDVRIERRETIQQRHHAQPPVRKRRADPQPSARNALVGDLLFGAVEIGEDAVGSLEIGLPLRGERQGAGGAQQQPDAEPLLDPIHGPTDRRRAHAKDAASSGEAAMLDDGGEQGECPRPIGSATQL